MEPPQHRQPPPPRPSSIGSAIFPVAVVILAVNAAFSVWHARSDPQSLAFALFSYTALTLIFWCVLSFERLPDDGGSASGRRRRLALKLAIWGLSAALSVAMCFRVSPMLPFVLTAATWAAAAVVLIAGFYALFIQH